MQPAAANSRGTAAFGERGTAVNRALPNRLAPNVYNIVEGVT
jgi:hypothetical protein